MSRFRTTAWLAVAFLASASAVAQEHQHGAMEDASRDMQGQAMQMTDGAHTSPASSQAAHMDHAHMSHADMGTGAMDDESMKHGSMGDGSMDAAATHHQAMDHASMDHSKMHHTQSTHPAQPPASPTGTPNHPLPRDPIPPPTADDIAAAFAPLHTHAMHSAGINHYVLLDRLEASNTDRGNGQAWESRAWIGGDIDRLWLRSEGERHDGRTESGSLEAFYGHAMSPWWDLLVGARQDIGAGAHRSWAAFGVQGLAPYKFETEATLYVGTGSRAALRLEGEYEVLLTNRLILQPRVEADIALTDDNRRGIGSGLEEVELGLRLRYEITRRFAPYIGWVHSRSFGDSAQRAAMDAAPARDSRFVAGVRVWF
ncbi:copper resistance protein B [Xanthomonas phaseoli]|uniref:Copper resistance protein B n=1 Tax=Xanthomonas manihotis TaxID=43353 RepID=A0A8I1XH69_XANMN|nr:copper resistance protein B [Xanthomonas phaseoli]KUF21067.1 copper resistance protein CopB [Xanthomonas phaseoli pv. manihotis]MBO9721906.1 copper resistance protein B [Xanthomonas phaseoli pv. manihotis]MBO9755174.1 copper resistance protein B [Xanthomonas phaseoli pv. manihotis]MBO9758836.1 copper resistance protein B [Xanthomonas phaseoli pv. manihotis]MBO9765798.1 copper resistance protein B [Xanthomonas phaseoli pv. manihotis]